MLEDAFGTGRGSFDVCSRGLILSGATFRPMTTQDLTVVMANEQAAYPIPWSQSVFEDSLSGSNHCWVVMSEGQVVGHAIVSVVLDEFHLLNICVSPAYQGKGLGRECLEFLIVWAQERNLAMFFLEVRASNEGAIALYHSAGFNEVGVRPNYYPADNGREDAILMTLQLSIDHYV